MKPRLNTFFIAALLASAGLSAMAQNRTSDDGAYEHHGAMHRMGSENMQEFQAKRSAELKAKLKITPAQDAGWTAFTNAMKPTAPPADTALDQPALTKLSTPERLDKLQAMHTERMTRHTAEMNKRHQAIKTLYATLSTEQKKTFDNETARMQDPSHHRAHEGQHDGKDH